MVGYQCLCTALGFLLSQLVVFLLQPFVVVLQKGVSKCSAIAASKLEKLKASEVKEKEPEA